MDSSAFARTEQALLRATTAAVEMERLADVCAKRIADLEEVLLNCREYFEQCADVVDGRYGEPAPNPEMRLLTQIDELLVMSRSGANS